MTMRERKRRQYAAANRLEAWFGSALANVREARLQQLSDGNVELHATVMLAKLDGPMRRTFKRMLQTDLAAVRARRLRKLGGTHDA